MNSTEYTVSARWIFPVSQPPLEHGRLQVRDSRVVAIESSTSRSDIQLDDHLLIPGLVNAHTHLDLSGARGIIPPTTDFTQWLKQVIEFRRSQTPDQVRSAIHAGIAELRRFGTCLVGDINIGGTSLDPLARSSLAAVIFREVLGLSDEAAHRAESELTPWLENDSASIVRAISPHAPYSVGRSLLDKVVSLGREKILAMHFAETAEEAELLTRRRGPFRSFLVSLGVWNEEALFRSHEELLERFESELKVFLVHGNYLDPRAKLPRGSVVIYCPRTYAAFGHAPHPFRDFLAAGHRVILGTDSLASNPDLDVLREAAFVHRLYPDFSSEKLLRMVTLDAAESLGFRDSPSRLGTIEIGSPLNGVALPISGSGRDPYELFWSATESDAERVLVRDLLPPT